MLKSDIFPENMALLDFQESALFFFDGKDRVSSAGIRESPHRPVRTGVAAKLGSISTSGINVLINANSRLRL